MSRYILSLIISILLITEGISAAVVYPSATPSAETTGGTFNQYFTNMFTPTCTNGQVISGFSSNGVPICVTGGGAGSSQWLSTGTGIYFTGSVAIGTTTPAVILDVNGEIKIANTSIACTSATEGSLRYNTTKKLFEGCDGTKWGVLMMAPKYTITWNAGSGTIIGSGKTIIPYPDAIESLPVATLTGYSFSGWYTEPVGGKLLTVGTVPEQNTTYYAQYNEIIELYCDTYSSAPISCAGLPDIMMNDGSLWKACNVGAKYLCQAGSYFQWGSNTPGYNIPAYDENWTRLYTAPNGGWGFGWNPIDYYGYLNGPGFGQGPGYDTLSSYTSVGSPASMQGPCPSGYHVPTPQEWCRAVGVSPRTTWWPNNDGQSTVNCYEGSLDAMYGASFLYLPKAGSYSSWNGQVEGLGSYQQYWTSMIYHPTYMTNNAFRFTDWGYGPSMNGYYQDTASATPVRCMKNPQTYTLTFDVNGGSGTNITQSWATGDPLVLPTATRSGYVFDGWYTAITGGTKVTSTTSPTGNTTYYAQWKKLYQVRFDPNGGVGEKILSIPSGQIGILPIQPTSSEYTFDGWYDSQVGGNRITSTTIINSDTTFYAQWTYFGPVTTYPGCNEPDMIVGSYKIASCNVGSTVSGTGDSTLNGSIFQWGRNTPFTALSIYGNTIAGPLSISSANATNKFITNNWGDWLTPRDDNKWGGASAQTYSESSYNDKSLMRGPCQAGYHVPTNNEWISIFDKLGVNGYTVGDVAINATNFLKIPLTSYYNGSGNGGASSQTYWTSTPEGQYGKLIAMNTSPIITSSPYINFGSDVRANALSVRCFANPIVTLTFDVNGGTVISSISGPAGYTFTPPANPTRAGYTFAGWSPALPSPSIIPASGATYTAQWISYNQWVSYTQCTSAGQTYTATSTYPGCSEPDKIICTANGQGYTWAMCNVGSSIAGTGPASYGSLFQWGRNVPFPNSGIIPTTTGPVSLATANATTNFIFSAGSPYDWLTPEDSVLWGSASDIDAYATTTPANQIKMKGPCSTGYHVPTYKEANDTIVTGLGSNITNFNTALKPPLSGSRYFSGGSSNVQGTFGYWWLSSPTSAYGRTVTWYSSAVRLSDSNSRGAGFGVRCLKN